jgi:hypothetical protein
MVFGKCTYLRCRRYLPMQNVLNCKEDVDTASSRQAHACWPTGVLKERGFNRAVHCGESSSVCNATLFHVKPNPPWSECVLRRSFRQREPHLKAGVAGFGLDLNVASVFFHNPLYRVQA